MFCNDAAVSETAFEQLPFRAPDEATEILLVRHGASQGFVPGDDFPVLGAQADPPLAPSGREQALQVCARLVTEPIDKVYVTKLQRTSETAAPLLAARDLEVEVSPDLHEIFLGDWEAGVSRVKLAEMTDPIAHEVRDTGSWDSVPGAERWADFTKRVMAGLTDIVETNPGGNVVAFVHGGVISAAVRALVGADRRFGHVENCSITHLVALDDTWMVKSFNDSAHRFSLFSRRPQ